MTHDPTPEWKSPVRGEDKKGGAKAALLLITSGVVPPMSNLSTADWTVILANVLRCVGTA